MSNTPIPIAERWPEDDELPVWWMVRSDDPECKPQEGATITHWQPCTEEMNPKPLPYSPKAVDAEIEDGLSTLSPAAQAVIDAFIREARPEPHHQREAIAAALRAAVASAPHEYKGGERWIRAEVLLAIATELENHQ